MTDARMFITDLDGTLFRSDHRFSDKDLWMLEELGRRGVVRVLATGRSLFSLERSLPCPLPVDYLIFSTGLGVARYPNPKDRTLITDGFTREDTRAIAAVLETLEMDYMIQDPVPDNHIFSYRQRDTTNRDFLTRLAHYQGCHRALESDTHDLERASQFLVIVPGTNGPERLTCLRRLLPAYSIINCSSPFDGKTMWIEIFPRTVSKSKAAHWLAMRLGIEPKDSVAVGNDHNDEDLLEWAGRAFVVENSPAAMKQRFDVVASNNRDGVCEAIEAMLSP